MALPRVVTDEDLIRKLNEFASKKSGISSPEDNDIDKHFTVSKHNVPRRTSEVTDPDLIQKLNSHVASKEPSLYSEEKGILGGLNETRKSLVRGSLQMGEGLLNSPANIASSFVGEKPVKEFEEKYLPEILRRSNINFGDLKGEVPLLGESLYNPNPSNIQKLVESIGKYAPYGMVGGLLSKGIGGASPGLLSRLAGQAGAGGLYGATQAENIKRGIPEGASYGAIGELGGSAISKTLGGIVNSLSDNLVKPLSESIKKKFKNDSGTFLTDTYHNVKKNYEKHLEKATNQWKLAEDRASNIDSRHNLWYEDQGRINGLDKIENELREKSKNFPSKEINSALDFVTHMKSKKIRSFKEAMEHGKGLNDVYGTMEFSDTPVPSNVVKRVIKNFKENMEGNFKEEPEIKKHFGDEWKKANKLTQQKYEIFHETPDGETSFIDKYRSKHPSTEYSDFIKDFLPKKGQEGIGNLKQLEEMLGSRDKASKAIRHGLFGQNPELKNILSAYNNLNELPKNYIFNKKQRTSLDALNNILKHSEGKTPEVNKSWMDKYGSKAAVTALASMVNPTAGAYIGAASLGPQLISDLSHILGSGITNIPGMKTLLIRHASGHPTLERKIGDFIGKKVPTSYIQNEYTGKDK